MKIFINPILAEFLKIKATPVYYIIAAYGLLIATFLIIGNTMDVQDLSSIGKNPWDSFLQKGMIIFSIFMVIPFLVLLISSMLYTEQRANTYKLLYTLPTSRRQIYFSKLLSIVILVIAECIIVGLLLLLSGYMLGYLYPEFEFYYYIPNYSVIISNLVHTFIAILGIIGIQYLLSLYFKHLLVPIGLSFLGLIIGFILFVVNHEAALYFPYSYPMIAQDLGLQDFDHRTIVLGNWLTNVELYSILVFIATVTLGYFYERRRSVK